MRAAITWAAGRLLDSSLSLNISAMGKRMGVELGGENTYPEWLMFENTGGLLDSSCHFHSLRSENITFKADEIKQAFFKYSTEE